jgi:hypothetical protein
VELADRETVVEKPWKPLDDWKSGQNVIFAAESKGEKG